MDAGIARLRACAPAACGPLFAHAVASRPGWPLPSFGARRLRSGRCLREPHRPRRATHRRAPRERAHRGPIDRDGAMIERGQVSSEGVGVHALQPVEEHVEVTGGEAELGDRPGRPARPRQQPLRDGAPDEKPRPFEAPVAVPVAQHSMHGSSLRWVKEARGTKGGLPGGHGRPFSRKSPEHPGGYLDLRPKRRRPSAPSDSRGALSEEADRAVLFVTSPCIGGRAAGRASS